MERNNDYKEQKIIEALKQGNALAFNSLFSVYSKRLYYFSFGYLKSHEEAEGVVQEVFLKIWKNRKQLNPKLSFKAYIFKIAFNHILELFNKINRQQEYKHRLIDESITFNDDLNERLNYQMLLQKVDKIVDKLPQRQKEIFIKRKKEGLAIKQIAEELGIKPKTVENHLTEALKNLKNGLGEEELSSMLFFLLFVKS